MTKTQFIEVVTPIGQAGSPPDKRPSAPPRRSARLIRHQLRHKPPCVFKPQLRTPSLPARTSRPRVRLPYRWRSSGNTNRLYNLDDCHPEVRQARHGDHVRLHHRFASRNDSPNIKGRWYDPAPEFTVILDHGAGSQRSPAYFIRIAETLLLTDIYPASSTSSVAHPVVRRNDKQHPQYIAHVPPTSLSRTLGDRFKIARSLPGVSRTLQR